MVVDLHNLMCGPCHVTAPILVDLAKKIPNVTFLKVDVDELEVKLLILFR